MGRFSNPVTTTGKVTVQAALTGSTVSAATFAPSIPPVTIENTSVLTSAANKLSVDSRIPQVGFGLTATPIPGGGTTFEINYAQTSNITSLGSLTGLTTTGILAVPSTLIPSTSTTTGAVTVNGAFTVNGALNSTSLAVSGTSSFNGLVSVTNSTLGTHPARLDYFTGKIALPGTGLVQNGMKLDMAASQPTITSIGTVSSTLNVDGIAKILNTTEDVTGALNISGGLGVAGNLYANFVIGNTLRALDGELNCSSRLYFNDQATTTSTTTGALVVSGGVRTAGIFSATALLIPYNAGNGQISWDGADGTVAASLAVNTANTITARCNSFAFVANSATLTVSRTLATFPVNVTVSDHVYPALDNLHTCGNATMRWTTVYAGAAIQTSDEREKKNRISLSTRSMSSGEFLDRIRPVEYRWSDKKETSLHFGVLAQNVAEAMREYVNDDIETSIVRTADDDMGTLSLEYSQLIPFLCQAVKEIAADLESIKGA